MLRKKDLCKFPTPIQSSKYFQNLGKNMQIVRYPTTVDFHLERLFISQQTNFGDSLTSPLVILSIGGCATRLGPRNEVEREEVLNGAANYLNRLLEI